MSRKFLLWAMAFVVIVPTLFGVGYWFYWDQFQRYAPVTIQNSADIAKLQSLLDRADYVSPDYQKAILTTGPASGVTTSVTQPVAKKWVYMVGFRTCDTCRAYEDIEFPRLQQGNIETRVIPFALADNGTVKQSTPEERSTIAELWLNRSWPLYVKWRNTPAEVWKAENIEVADNDLARSGVVWASRDFINQIAPILRNNKVNVAYPLVFWRNKNNDLRVCSCSSKKAYHFIRQDLGLPGDLETDVKGLLHLPMDFKPFGSESAASSSSSSLAPAPGLNYGPDSSAQ
ncbi:hypothetical protein [Asticcacaulis sp. 201]|uniref:hypothetical protein n=1 Tax=Asticcacaulis sp. 201 TaxID=3028787 RepID=UPI002915C8EF|nr:hypothetical protein [Asticcacaulis sp. 201]MDV6331407.1 hypothetical protein [Asticcacaulis sp. 201]